MAETIELDDIEYTLEWGFGVIKDAQAISMEGLDNEKFTEAMKRRQIKGDEKDLTIEEYKELGIDLVSTARRQNQKASKYILLFLTRMKDGDKVKKDFNEEFIRRKLDPVHGEILNDRIQEILNEHHKLSQETKKKYIEKQNGTTKDTP